MIVGLCWTSSEFPPLFFPLWVTHQLSAIWFDTFSFWCLHCSSITFSNFMKSNRLWTRPRSVFKTSLRGLCVWGFGIKKTFLVKGNVILFTVPYLQVSLMVHSKTQLLQSCVLHSGVQEWSGFSGHFSELATLPSEAESFHYLNCRSSHLCPNLWARFMGNFIIGIWVPVTSKEFLVSKKCLSVKRECFSLLVLFFSFFSPQKFYNFIFIKFKIIF